jgi:hypothetical protein
MNLVLMHGRKLTISEVVQLNFIASSCCVQSRERANGPSADNYNLLRRHCSKGFDRVEG